MPGTVVNVNGGTLNANAADALGTTATVNVVTGATFNLGASQTVSALDGAGMVNLAAGGSPNTLTIGSTDNLASNFSGSIVDGSLGGSVTVNTTNTVTLSGINTYTGTTTLNAGTLIIGDNTRLVPSAARSPSSRSTAARCDMPALRRTPTYPAASSHSAPTAQRSISTATT